MPVSFGGLGLRGAENHAAAAHLSSLLSSQLLVQDLTAHHPGVPLQQEEEEVLMGTLEPGLLAALSAAQGEEARAADLAGLNQKQM